MSGSRNQITRAPTSNVKQSLMQAVFPLVKAVAGHIPGSRKLAQGVYNLMPSEHWINVHGIPLLCNIHDNGIGTFLFIQGGYALGRVSEICEVVEEGNVVVDVGANIGYFTALLANLVGPRGRVYAFEPDPRNIELLQHTIKRNGWTHVIAERKAVSNKAGNFLLYQARSWAANAITPTEHVSSVNVQVVTLDEFLSDEDHIDFVKMDMDGSEPLAIQGMTELIRRSPRLHVLAEYEPGNLKRYLNNPLDFITIAEQHGLKLTAILDSSGGRLPSLDLAALTHLADNANLDLLFTVSTLIQSRQQK